MTPAERKAYNKLYKATVARVPYKKLCDCGNPATIRHNSANICQRCADIESRNLRLHEDPATISEAAINRPNMRSKSSWKHKDHPRHGEYLAMRRVRDYEYNKNYEATRNIRRREITAANQQRKLRQHAAVQHAMAVGELNSDV